MIGYVRWTCDGCGTTSPERPLNLTVRPWDFLLHALPEGWICETGPTDFRLWCPPCANRASRTFALMHPESACWRCATDIILADTEHWDHPVCPRCHIELGEPPEEPPNMRLARKEP